jgi:hypothetical protein
VPPAGRWQYSNLTSPRFRGFTVFWRLVRTISGEHSPFSPDETRSLSSPASGQACLKLSWINSRKQSPLCAIESGYQSCLRGTDRGRGDPEPVARGA